MTLEDFPPTLEQQRFSALENLNREALEAMIHALRKTLLIVESEKDWLEGALDGAQGTVKQYQEIAEGRLETIGKLRQECTDLERERNRAQADLEERRIAVSTLLDGSEQDSIRYGKLTDRLTNFARNNALRAILLEEVIDEMQETFNLSLEEMEDRGWSTF